MNAVNQARNFAANNRSLIVNTVYIVAVLVILYFLIQFYLTGKSLDKMLLENRISATRSTGLSTDNPYDILIADNTTSADVRIKQGGEFTISYWIYIQNWSSDSNKNIDVLTISDETLTKSDKSGNYVLACGLYANEPKMMVRANLPCKDYPGISMDDTSNMPACDVMDIDLQRWMHVTVSVNGRIMDVYLDGKLSRSCIMSQEIRNLSSSGKQYVNLAPFGGFKGYFSGVQFSAYAVTPDQIYARYLAGPYSSRSFLDYIKEKIGISITYKYAGQDAE